MRTKYFNLTIVIFSGVTLVIFAVLAVITVRDSIKYNVLIDRNSLKQGYWIIKSLEFIYNTENENRDYLISHAMDYINNDPNVFYITIFDKNKNTIIASNTSMEEIKWPEDSEEFSQNGTIIGRDSRHNISMLFPVFLRDFQKAKTIIPIKMVNEKMMHGLPSA